MDPYRSPGVAAASPVEQLPARVIGRADIMLGLGLCATSLGSSLVPFTMIGLAGIALLLVTNLLFIGAAAVSRTADRSSNGKQIASLALYVIGVVLLTWAALDMILLVSMSAMAPRIGLASPSVWSWGIVMLAAIVSAVSIACAVKLRTGCSRSRFAFWCVAALFVSPAAAALFVIFHRLGLPTTA